MVSEVSVNSRPEAKQVDRATTNYRVGACEDSVSLQLLPLPCHNIPQHILKGRLRGLPVLFPLWRWRGLHPGLKEVPHAHYTMCPPLDYRDRGRPGKQRGMHNAGGGNHVARLVLLELMSENGLSAGDIAEIQAEVVPRRDEGLTSSVHHANTSLSHSGREVLALAALHGGVGLREAHDEKFSNTPEFSGMLERVKIFTLEPRYLSYSRAWAHSLTGACSTAASARNNLTILSANRL